MNGNKRNTDTLNPPRNVKKKHTHQTRRQRADYHFGKAGLITYASLSRCSQWVCVVADRQRRDQQSWRGGQPGTSLVGKWHHSPRWDDAKPFISLSPLVKPHRRPHLGFLSVCYAHLECLALSGQLGLVILFFLWFMFSFCNCLTQTDYEFVPYFSSDISANDVSRCLLLRFASSLTSTFQAGRSQAD